SRPRLPRPRRGARQGAPPSQQLLAAVPLRYRRPPRARVALPRRPGGKGPGSRRERLSIRHGLPRSPARRGRGAAALPRRPHRHPRRRGGEKATEVLIMPMNRPRVLVSQPIPASALERLQALAEVEAGGDARRILPRSELIERIRRADVLLDRKSVV